MRSVGAAVQQLPAPTRDSAAWNSPAQVDHDAHQDEAAGFLIGAAVGWSKGVRGAAFGAVAGALGGFAGARASHDFPEHDSRVQGAEEGAETALLQIGSIAAGIGVADALHRGVGTVDSDAVATGVLKYGSMIGLGGAVVGGVVPGLLRPSGHATSSPDPAAG